MDADIENACNSIGWDTLYERYIDNLSVPSRRGERNAKSPFPFSSDSGPSFNVNTLTGLWRDWHLQNLSGGKIKGGNIVQFLALMQADLIEGEIVNYDPSEAERELRIELGISQRLDEEYIQSCSKYLNENFTQVSRLINGRKPWWSIGVLNQLEVGFDCELTRFIFPIRSHRGTLINARAYRPGGKPKIVWKISGTVNANILFPAIGNQEPYSILTEGEPDAISLRMFGFNGVSGTCGSGAPLPGGDWYHNKDIFILMDSDEHGEKAATLAASFMQMYAKSIVKCTLPVWPDKPSNADISDWLMYLSAEGNDVPQVQQKIVELLQSGTVVKCFSTSENIPATHFEYQNALSSVNSGTKLSFDCHIDAISGTKYKTPTHIQCACPATGWTACKKCQMSARYAGNANIDLNPVSEVTLQFIQTDLLKQKEAVCRHLHFYHKCPDLQMVISEGVDITPVMVAPSINDNAFGRERYEAFVVGNSNNLVEDNSDYKMTGYCYPMPKTQKLAMVVQSTVKLENDIDSFSLTPEMYERLKSFQPLPNETPFDVLYTTCEDIADTRTFIKGRPDLHMALKTMWHSVIKFPFSNYMVERGWIELIVIGDTGCGKSATFQKMKQLYQTGEYVDSKNQTVAGVLGAVESSLITGERYVVAGLMPRQDRRGPICFDEFSSHNWNQTTLLDLLSATRAEGKVTITKAARASFPARVRSVWYANPGIGKLMSDMSINGCELLTRVIKQPEDIRRFDMAMSVAKEDVSSDIINQLSEPDEKIWSDEDYRNLLMWTWSRTPEQITWDIGAQQEVIDVAIRMCKKYDPTIPIVENADQRNKVAKVAISIAAQVFSTTDGEDILIRIEHVQTAERLFDWMYCKPSFAYNTYSERCTQDRKITDTEQVKNMLDECFADAKILHADKMLKLHEFTINMIETMFPLSRVRGNLQVLFANKCLAPARGTSKDVYELTPQFVHFLKKYIADEIELLPGGRKVYGKG